MANIYVHSATGNDTTGNGSSSTPYQTLNKALTVATAGSTIYPIANSTAYSLSNTTIPAGITITAIASDLTTTPYIQNPLIDHVVLDGASTNAIWTLSTTLTMNNIILKDWVDNGSHNAFIVTRQATGNAVLTLNNCEFRDCGISTSTGSRGGLFGNGATTTTPTFTDMTYNFNHCIFNNVKAIGTTVAYYSLIRNGGTVYVNTTNCTWYADSSGFGVQFFASTGNSGAAIATISHKNLAINQGHATTLDLGNAGTESANGGVYTGSITQVANTTNYTNADPQFSDPAGNLFHLKPDSPAIRGGQAI